MKIVVCIPTYNEAKNIKRLINQIFTHCNRHGFVDTWVLIIDDNSPDGTGDIVKQLQREYSHLLLLERSKQMGLGSAYKAGFLKALSLNADIVCEMDADFSHDPNILPFFFRALQKYDCDLIIGSRRVKGGRVLNWGIHRKLISAGANLFAHFLLKLRTRDVTSGYRAIKADLLRKIQLKQLQTNGYAFQLELLYILEKKLKAETREIPITFVDRQFGKSKLGVKSIAEFLIELIRLRLFGSNVPHLK